MGKGEAGHFSRCRQLTAEARFADSARCFAEYDGAFPNSMHADKALFNAGIAFQKAGLNREAIKTLERLVRDFGSDSGLAGVALYVLAETHLWLGGFDKAATYYETYLEDFPLGQKVRECLVAAIALRSVLGQWESAAALSARYVEFLSRGTPAARAHFYIGRLYARAGRWKESAESYKKFLKRFRRDAPFSLALAAYHGIGEAMLQLGRPEEAREQAGQLLKVFDRLRGRGRLDEFDQDLVEAVAWAQYLLVDELVAALQAGAPDGGKESIIRRKIELAEKAEARLVAVIGLKSPVVNSGALVRLGKLWEGVADSVAAFPPGAVADPSGDAAAGEGSAEDPMETWRNKAFAAYEACLMQAREKRRYDSHVDEACLRLRALGRGRECVTEYVTSPVYYFYHGDGEEMFPLAPPTATAARKMLDDSRRAMLEDVQDADAPVEAATAWYMLNYFERAQFVCMNTRAVIPRNPRLLNLMGLLQLKKGNFHGAAYMFETAASIDPPHIPAHMNMAYFLLKSGNFVDALESTEIVLESLPEHRGFLLNQAVALRGLGRFEEARAVLAELSACDDEVCLALYNLCVLLQDYMEERELALDACGRFRETIDESHPRFEELEARLKRLR